MSRSINRLMFSSSALALLFAFGALAAGCAGTPSAISDIRYDLGPVNPPATSGPLPVVQVLDVSAPDTLESDKLIYRLGYADAQQTASYANSHWTTAPSQLLTQRLRTAPWSSDYSHTTPSAAHRRNRAGRSACRIRAYPAR